MNPSELSPPPRFQRPLFVTLLFPFSLVVFFAWFLFMRVQETRYQAVGQAGAAALAKKDTKRARDLFDTFLRARPNDPLAYKAVSEVCAAFEQPTMAIEYAQRGLDACKDAPNAPRALLYLQLAESQSLAEPAHPQTKAIASARTALSLDPQNFQMQNAIGYMLVDNDQNLNEAEKLLRAALKSLKPAGEDPLSDELRPAMEDSYGWLLYKKTDYVGAVAALNQASHDLPTGTPGYGAKYFFYHLGAAYRKTGQTEEARRALAVALQYDPAFAEAKAEVVLLPPPNTPAASPAVSPPVGSSPSVPASAPGLKL
jgi:tetratricopeptide (TPR) repeat protein